MWMMVMFDLPVQTAEERKAASDFREDLKDLGFVMAQYSVYLKYTSGQSECDALTEKVRRQLPEGGRVYVHCLTDRQYEKIVRFEQRKKLESQKNPEQYALFNDREAILNDPVAINPLYLRDLLATGA